MRISANSLKTFFSSQTPYRQKCPTTSNSDVRLSCSNQECWRYRPCVASPRAAALLWGNGALIRQRVIEYHNAPPGLTAKYRPKSSIFSAGSCCHSVPPSFRQVSRAVFMYIDVFPDLLVPVAGTESPNSTGIAVASYRFGPSIADSAGPPELNPLSWGVSSRLSGLCESRQRRLDLADGPPRAWLPRGLRRK